MFIATANTLDTIPGPLRDRMEVIEIAGYTEEEKLQIAKRYLVPRQIERNGLKRKQISIHDRALRAVIRDYTARPACATSSARSARSAARSPGRSPRGPSRAA
jgi:ATP-dependent Lon protease